MNARIGGTILYLFSQLVHKTGRFSISGFERAGVEGMGDEPLIITSWHGMTMMVAAFIRTHMDITRFNVIMPDDQRGANLEVFAERLGVKAVRLDLSGDSTFRTGRRLAGLIREIKGGRRFLIHPDGPAGPAYHVKPGLAYIARKTGARILPIGCYCRNAYHLHRWDRYTLPLPFSRINIQVGKPIYFRENDSSTETIRRNLEDTLNRLSLQAAANYYEMG